MAQKKSPHFIIWLGMLPNPIIYLVVLSALAITLPRDPEAGLFDRLFGWPGFVLQSSADTSIQLALAVLTIVISLLSALLVQFFRSRLKADPAKAFPSAWLIAISIANIPSCIGLVAGMMVGLSGLHLFLFPFSLALVMILNPSPFLSTSPENEARKSE